MTGLYMPHILSFRTSTFFKKKKRKKTYHITMVSLQIDLYIPHLTLNASQLFSKEKEDPCNNQTLGFP